MPDGDGPNDRAELPRGLRRLWGLDAGPRPGQRPSLEIRQIVQAAIGLADAEGLAGVSMSRVARELGVTTMALYRYVESKDELLELMLEVAAGDPPELAPDLDWRSALLRWALNLAELYRAHPWSLEVPLPGPPRGPHQLAWMEQGLAALRPTALGIEERVMVEMLVMSHVRGEASLERQLAGAIGEDGGAQMERDFVHQLRSVVDADRFPELSAMLAEGSWGDGGDDPVRGPSTAGGGPFGLERILDGIELLVRERRQPWQATP